MTNDLRTIGRAMREAQRKYYGDSDEHSPGDLLATELAFDKALEAAPAPQGDNAGLIALLRLPFNRAAPEADISLPGWAFELMSEAAAALEVAKARDAEGIKVCDSYAAENQRLFDRAEAAERQLAEAREALELYRDAVRFDVLMSGPRFLGPNVSALKRAWEHDRAALGRK